jgi:hypothetical protein
MTKREQRIQEVVAAAVVFLAVAAAFAIVLW